MPSKAIAFLRLRSLPLANQVVFQRLQTVFPDYRFDLYDLSDLVKERPGLVARNGWPTLRHYGLDMLLGHKPRHRVFWRTPFMFRAVNELLRELVDPADYAFTFQMQSIFDGHVPGLPHFVYTDHTHLENFHYPEVNSERLFPPLWTNCEREIYQNATRVFVRSQNIVHSLLEEYGIEADRVECVYAGANVAVEDRPVAPPTSKQPNVLFIGYDWERKGGPDLVKAMAIVQKRLPEASLTIIGCNPEIELANCVAMGPLDPSELEPYFQEACLFCMPTRLEPFGIVYVEAMARGLPVVATNIGAITDMVEHNGNGLLVEPGDISGLADALLQLLENLNMAAEFGRVGLKLAHSRYNWDKVVARIAQAIQETTNVSL